MGSIDGFLFSRSWTQDDVGALMRALHPLPAGRQADDTLHRQRLCSAFLAGAAQSHGDGFPALSGRALVGASIRTARMLLKNRAASQSARLWHAFMAGAHAVRTGVALPGEQADPSTPRAVDAPLKLFIRQPLTESGQAQQDLVAAVLERIDEHNGRPHAFSYLAGRKAESADTFRASFEAETGHPFSPQAFRSHRLSLLSQAEAFVNIRVGMSESSAFELSYHVFHGAGTPVLFLVWKHAPIKTTLLKDLDNLCDITYVEFEHADDVRDGVGEFLQRVAHRAAAAAA